MNHYSYLIYLFLIKNKSLGEGNTHNGPDFVNIGVTVINL